MSDTDKTSAKLVATTRTSKAASTATPAAATTKKAVAKKAVAKKAPAKKVSDKPRKVAAAKKASTTTFSHGRRVWPD